MQIRELMMSSLHLLAIYSSIPKNFETFDIFAQTCEQYVPDINDIAWS